jgi:D-hydroxyproline dehydrogenase subunit alpha
MPRVIAVRVNGQSIDVVEGTSAAAAVVLSGGFSRTSVSGEARAPFCGMGTCFECRCEIDGQPHQRGCQVMCRPGMEIRADSSTTMAALGGSAETKRSGAGNGRMHFEVAVVGAGPAGIAAAAAASESGHTVAVLDDNPSAGGQIWRGESVEGSSAGAATWLRRLRGSAVKVIPSARVFHLEAGNLAAENDAGILELSYHEVILATGARELFLPFPGWTLRGVFGAGGLQALLKTGLAIEGKRMVVAGTGPLLLAVAAYAQKHGANVVAICEQADGKKVARFGMATTRAPGKLKDALRFGWALRGVPYWTSAWPTAALGGDRLESVRVSRKGRVEEIACDYLACGFHLVPNLELASFAGCAIEEGFVEVDEFQRTPTPHIYCAGETTGIGGLEKSIVEGRIAGYAVTGNERKARRLFPERAGCARFAAEMKSAFRLRPEVKSLATPDTLLCRCEDISLGRAKPFASWREAKLHTRCGMGPCQGRVCGSAAEVLFGWKVDSVRPPVFAVQCGSLAAVTSVAGTGATSIERA